MMASVYNVLFKRLSRINLTDSIRRFTSPTGQLFFRATAPVCAEPMKKRKKVDMQVVIQREQKKMRKLEKAIHRQETKGRILKPVEEIEGNRGVLKTLYKRKRATTVLSFEESERRASLIKDWSRYKRVQHIGEMKAVGHVQESQRQALDELRKESEELYQQAVQLDEGLIPFEFHGPVETPPIKGFTASDGEYIDTTRKFDK